MATEEMNHTEVLDATHKALSTAELLEAVLASTSALDVYRSRRTNTFFKNVIDNSMTLQKKLFFQADQNIRHAIWALNSHHTITDVDLPSSATPLRVTTGERYLYNPILFSALKPGNKISDINCRPNKMRVTTLYLEAILRCEQVSQIRSHPNAKHCWDMFITQPPITRMQLRIRLDSHIFYTPGLPGRMFITKPPITEVWVDIERPWDAVRTTYVRNSAGIAVNDVLAGYRRLDLDMRPMYPYPGASKCIVSCVPRMRMERDIFVLEEDRRKVEGE